MITDVRQAIVSLEARMDRRFVGIDQRLSSLDDKMSRQFYWIVGIQMTTFVATIATVLAAILAR